METNSLSLLDKSFRDRSFKFHSLENQDLHSLENQDQIEESIEDCIEQVQFLMDHGDYDLSSHLLSVILKKNPHHMRALSLMSVCSKFMNQPHKILFFVKRIMKVSKFNFKRNLFYADLLIEHQLRSEAKSIYLSLLKYLKGEGSSIQREEAFFDLYMRLGDLCLEELNFEEAKGFYSEAEKINTQNDSLWVRFGSLACQKKNFEKALFYFREALRKNDKNDLAWLGLSLIHRLYGDYELSWANLERALDIHILNERALKICFLWARETAYGNYRLVKILERAKQSQKDEEIKMRVGLLLARVFYDLGQYENSLLELNEITSKGKKCKGVFTLKVLLREAFKKREFLN